MFQFDAGSYVDTVQREGNRILLIDGNIEAAVDFVLAMVQRSDYISGVATEASAIAWLNQWRPYEMEHDAWIKTVVRYYNGCNPDRCGSWQDKLEHYDSHLIARYEEFGDPFWYSAERGSAPSSTVCRV